MFLDTILLTNYHDKETLIKAYDQEDKIHFAQVIFNAKLECS